MKNKILYVGNKHTNYSSRKGKIPDIIVNHISQGSKESCISWFTSKNNSKSSAHFLVGKDGSIYQFVKIEDMAWANGLYLEDIKYSKLDLIKKRNMNPNRYSISIEHEGIYEETQGRLTEKQLNASIWLHKYILDYLKDTYCVEIPIDREHIVGHFEVDPIRKPFCPGDLFPFEVIIEKLKGNSFYKDIEKHWAKSDIIDLSKRGYFQGYPDGTFRPNENVTRGEIASILGKLIKDDA